MKKKFSLYTLAEREQREAKAGQEVIFNLCRCGCAWANCGGSSTTANHDANEIWGLVSREFEPQDAG